MSSSQMDSQLFRQYSVENLSEFSEKAPTFESVDDLAILEKDFSSNPPSQTSSPEPIELIHDSEYHLSQLEKGMYYKNEEIKSTMEEFQLKVNDLFQTVSRFLDWVEDIEMSFLIRN